MTSPARKILVRCPGCDEEFEGWHRASINLSLGEDWTPEELREASTATCPHCGRVVELDALVVDGPVWTFGGAS